MKKFLLLFTLLLSISGRMMAQSYTLDFSDEITSLEEITDGTPFVMVSTDERKILTFSNGDIFSHLKSLADVDLTTDYCYFVLDNDNGALTDGNYRIKIQNGSGTPFVGENNGCYLSRYRTSGENIHRVAAGISESPNYGNEANLGKWLVQYDSTKGFSFSITFSSTKTRYINFSPSSGDTPTTDSSVSYVKLYKKANRVATKEITSPIILKGGKSNSSFTTDCYLIEVDGWNNFIAYEDAEGVSFDENSTMVFDMDQAVSNGNVRVTFYFSDGTNREEWWCLGIGTSPDDTSNHYNHAFDNSTYYIKKGLGSNFDAKKDYKITKVTVNNFNGGNNLYQIKGGTICGQPMTIKKGSAKSIGCYSGVFSATDAFTNVIQYKPFTNVGDFQKLVIKFGEAVPETGNWKVATSGTEYHSLKGKTVYEIALNGSAIEDFTIFNWDANPAPINISEVYLYKAVKMNTAANTALLASATKTGYNEETGYVEEGTWSFDTPIDVTPWQYLVITTSQSAGNTSSKIRIKDSNGVSVETSDNEHDGFRGMVLDRWNNQNIVCIDLYYLQETKGIDLTKIQSVEIKGYYGGSAKIYMGQMYLTNYLNSNIISSSTWHDGDLQRNYTETGKFGTICLPYVASVTGALVYEIASGSTNGITLSLVDGLLEAGKPYFYMSNDVQGVNNGGAVRNVHFFRADIDKFDVSAPIPNNGLIGTFEAMTAPAGANYFVLSGNLLYDTENSTVNVGANKAYIDVNQITNTDAKNRMNLYFNGTEEATGIDQVEAVQALTSGKVYDLSGRVVTCPTRGLYIINGKKVVIK